MREARESSRWSQRDLAERAGVSFATIAELEGGQGSLVSTLRRVLGALPGLGARDLVPGLEPAPPRACDAAWAAARAIHDLAAARIVTRTEVLPSGGALHVLRLEGVRSLAYPLDIHGRRLAMRTACVAPVALKRALPQCEVPCAPIVVKDGDDRHVFTWGQEPDGAWVFDYERTRESRDHEGVDPTFPLLLPSADVQHSVDELVMERAGIDDATAGTLRCVAFLHRAAAPGLGWDLASALHPDGLRAEWDPAAATLRVRVPRPQPWMLYGLTEDVAPCADVPRPVTLHREGAAALDPLAVAVRHAKAALALSRREVARRAGVSPDTVDQAERGADLRLPKAAALARALGLRPQDVLPFAAPAVEWDRTQHYEWLRDLFGFEAETLHSHHHVVEGGYGANVTIGLRFTRAARPGTEIVIADPYSESDVKRMDMRLRGSVPGLRAKRRMRDGARLEPTAILGDGAAPGELVTLRKRHWQWDGRSLWAPFAEPPIRSGRIYRTNFPCRDVRLELSFPRGYVPRGPYIGVCFARLEAGILTNEELEMLRPRARATLGEDLARSRLRLDTSLAPPGLELGLSWCRAVRELAPPRDTVRDGPQ